MNHYRAALLDHLDGLPDSSPPYAVGDDVPGGPHLAGENLSRAVVFANDGREPDWQSYAGAERAHQAAALGALLAILRDVHDTLASESDSDIDHFEDDEEEREGAPVQYAARKVMEVMDTLKATAPRASGTPEGPKGRA